MRTEVPEEAELGFQITPIVDLVATLIMFFMTTAAMIAKEGQIGVTLPGQGAPGESAVVEQELYIGILPDGMVTLNEAPIGTPSDSKLEPLRQKLRTFTNRWGTKIPVFIQPAPNTVHQRVVDVLDACAASGIKNLSFSEVAG